MEAAPITAFSIYKNGSPLTPLDGYYGGIQACIVALKDCRHLVDDEGQPLDSAQIIGVRCPKGCLGLEATRVVPEFLKLVEEAANCGYFTSCVGSATTNAVRSSYTAYVFVKETESQRFFSPPIFFYEQAANRTSIEKACRLTNNENENNVLIKFTESMLVYPRDAAKDLRAKFREAACRFLQSHDAQFGHGNEVSHWGTIWRTRAIVNCCAMLNIDARTQPDLHPTPIFALQQSTATNALLLSHILGRRMRTVPDFTMFTTGDRPFRMNGREARSGECGNELVDVLTIVANDKDHDERISLLPDGVIVLRPDETLSRPRHRFVPDRSIVVVEGPFDLSWNEWLQEIASAAEEQGRECATKAHVTRALLEGRACFYDWQTEAAKEGSIVSPSIRSAYQDFCASISTDVDHTSHRRNETIVHEILVHETDRQMWLPRHLFAAGVRELLEERIYNILRQILVGGLQNATFKMLVQDVFEASVAHVLQELHRVVLDLIKSALYTAYNTVAYMFRTYPVDADFKKRIGTAILDEFDTQWRSPANQYRLQHASDATHLDCQIADDKLGYLSEILETRLHDGSENPFPTDADDLGSPEWRAALHSAPGEQPNSMKRQREDDVEEDAPPAKRPRVEREPDERQLVSDLVDLYSSNVDRKVADRMALTLIKTWPVCLQIVIEWHGFYYQPDVAFDINMIEHFRGCLSGETCCPLCTQAMLFKYAIH